MKTKSFYDFKLTNKFNDFLIPFSFVPSLIMCACASNSKIKFILTVPSGKLKKNFTSSAPVC